MISKSQRTVWQDSHSHHDFRKAPYRLFWGRATKTYRTERSELPDSDETPALYPPAVLKSLEEAIKRCPSISIDADIMEGQPCIAGTRIPVRAVLRAIELYGAIKGATMCYPQLSIEQVEDALYFSQVILEPPSGLNETTVAT